MNIVSVTADNGEYTVTTTEGQFTRWPGREVNGHAWWSYTPTAGGRAPLLVTVPETVRYLEARHRKAVGVVRPLRLVKGAA